jgi:hypothetical protein
MGRSTLLRCVLLSLVAVSCSQPEDDDEGTPADPSQAGSTAGPAAGTTAASGGGGTTGGGSGSGAGGATAAPSAGSSGGSVDGDAGSSARAGSGGDAGTPATAGAGGSGAAGTDGRDPNAVNPYPGFTSTIYADDAMWMCKPGATKNYCLENIADATEALPDGTFQPFMDTLGTEHPIDCIFWYPTVNRSEDPTSYDFSDPEPMLSSIRSQAARFSRVCNVYAPFYRQRSLDNGGDAELGYMDVVESFKQYVANWSEGRSFVVYGHSQGTGHAMRLINQEINGNEDLRNRLVSALMIGGGLAATTFSNIPLCTAPDQFGCAIGYRAYGVPQSLGNIPADLACTNPGALGGGKVMMKGSFFKSRGTNYSDDLGADFTATWGLYRDFFSAECVEAPSGGQVLMIDYTEDASDMRVKFLDLSVVIGFGLHVFDYQFPLDDLVELVRTQREAKLAVMP